MRNAHSRFGKPVAGTTNLEMRIFSPLAVFAARTFSIAIAHAAGFWMLCRRLSPNADSTFGLTA
jgi:hypothetical protein